jgi:tetratricopeptide (TPR) repeat protein
MLQQEQSAKTQKISEDLQRVNGEYLSLATTLIGNQQFDEAARLLERVRESSPDEPRLEEVEASLQASRDAYRQRIIQRHIEAIEGAMVSGQLQDASKRLDDLATLAPENQNLEELRSRLNQMLEKDRIRKERIATLIRQAQSLTEDDRAEERMDIYQQVLALDPRNRTAQEGVENARTELAQAHFESRQKARETSAASLRKARELFEQQPISAENYQQAYLYLLEAQQLDRHSQPLLALVEELPQLYLDAIRGTMSRGDYDEADRLLQSAVVLAPADERFQQLRAELLELAGEQQQPVLPVSF